MLWDGRKCPHRESDAVITIHATGRPNTKRGGEAAEAEFIARAASSTFASPSLGATVMHTTCWWEWDRDFGASK